MTSTSTSTHSLRCIPSCIHHCRQFSYIITLLVLPCNSHTFPSKSCRIINKINPARALQSDFVIQLNQLDLLVRTPSCTLRRYFIFVQNERSSTYKVVTSPTSPTSPRVRFSNNPTPPSPGTGPQKSALSQSQSGSIKSRPPRVIRTFEEIDRIVPREEWYEELECGM